jgi:energy-converting hydrogenase Eha subunit A
MKTTFLIIVCVYFALNFLVAVISALLNAEIDKDDERSAWLRFGLNMVAGFPLVVFALAVSLIVMALNSHDDEDEGNTKI